MTAPVVLEPLPDRCPWCGAVPALSCDSMGGPLPCEGWEDAQEFAIQSAAAPVIRVVEGGDRS